MSIVTEAGLEPLTVWTGTENLAPTSIRSPDRPTRSEAQYRLSCPGLPIEQVSDVSSREQSCRSLTSIYWWVFERTELCLHSRTIFVARSGTNLL